MDIYGSMDLLHITSMHRCCTFLFALSTTAFHDRTQFMHPYYIFILVFIYSHINFWNMLVAISNTNLKPNLNPKPWI